jgi:Holliday junction resolvase
MREDIPLENTITAGIQRYLGRLPDWWGFKVQGSGSQMRGVPDIVGCYRGLFVGFEVKRPIVGRVSELQKHRIEQIKSAGGQAFVVYSVEDVKQALDMLSAVTFVGGGG